jgi:heptose-I-phosphate ethanolaminephosphotransferase
VLNTEARKKLIIVHLLGTHRKYAYRYPPSYEHFSTDENVPSWISEELLEEYNSYDNAILYNDYVISKLIGELKKAHENSALVYLSDHGEEVFDTPSHLFAGRDEANPLPAMYTIPFMIWASPEYQIENETSSWSGYEERPYTSANFIYTWADIAGIKFKEMDQSRSILSKHFTLQPRWIGNPDEQKSLQDYSFAVEKVTDKFVLKM